MSVRFDVDGESYTRVTGLAGVASWTVTCWARLAVNRGTTTVLWQIDNGTGTSRLRCNAWDGAALTYQTDDGGWFGLAGQTMTVGTWYYIGISADANPGLVRVRVRAAGSATWGGGNPAQANVTISANTLRLGDGQAANEFLNGSLAAVKVWNAPLTLEELELESWTYMPQRTTGIRGWYPFTRVETVDYSGQSQVLTGGSGATLEDGPPIPWQRGRRRIVVSAASPGIAGQVAGSLPPLGGAAAGAARVSGQAASALPSMSAAVQSSVEVSGDVDGALPAFSAAVDGFTHSPGQLAGTLPALSAVAEGLIPLPGELVGTLPPLGAAAEGEVLFGAVDATLSPFNAALAGAAVVEGAADAALPGFSSEMAADVIYDVTVDTPGPDQGWSALPPARPIDTSGVARGWVAGRPTT
ncbi:LamG-like jellyroll fold domain-containing protein [Nonomuraea helvata]|uniref:LamG-like jellyroll fold domain-containing protein n=1 Tax=Nonomuraea helvata TaxID=37484 RepID=A0ABV5SK21_9ACTN